MYGLKRLSFLDDVLVLHGAGVGGGSHVYGSTLYVPPKKFFAAPEWSYITDWYDEMPAYFDQAHSDRRFARERGGRIAKGGGAARPVGEAAAHL